MIRKEIVYRRSYIKKHPVITVGDGAKRAPIGFLDANGAYVGMAKDYLDIVAKNTGLRFKIVTGK